MGWGQPTWTHVLVGQGSVSGVTWWLRQTPTGVDLAHVHHRHPTLAGQLDTWDLELVTIDSMVTMVTCDIVTDTGPGQHTGVGSGVIPAAGQLEHAPAGFAEDGERSPRQRNVVVAHTALVVGTLDSLANIAWSIVELERLLKQENILDAERKYLNVCK